MLGTFGIGTFKPQKVMCSIVWLHHGRIYWGNVSAGFWGAASKRPFQNWKIQRSRARTKNICRSIEKGSTVLFCKANFSHKESGGT
ncbi:MAG: hypothetical protein L0J94_07130, partial [Corynebacterium flavescens]|nr:hypothetical protein [Corynebacterium flavescens]